MHGMVSLRLGCRRCERFVSFIFLRHFSPLDLLQKFAFRVLGAQLVPSEKLTQQEHRRQTAEIDEENVRSGHGFVQPAEFKARFFVKVNPNKASEKCAGWQQAQTQRGRAHGCDDAPKRHVKLAIGERLLQLLGGNVTVAGRLRPEKSDG